jgi:WD40-like Beta Propeller Repeat
VVQIDALTGATTPIGKLSFVPTDLVLAADQKTIYAGRPGAVAGDSLPTVDVVRWRPGGQEADVATDVTAFALSPDGTRLAMARPRQIVDVAGGTSPPPMIVERDLVSGSERSWAHGGYELDSITQLNYSPDGSQLAYSASFESASVYTFAVDSAVPPGRLIEVGAGSKEVLSDSFDGVDWLDNNTLVVVGNCCYAEGSHPSELLTIRTTGELLKRQELDHSVAVDVDPATGRWVVQRQVSDASNTTFISVREPDGTVRDFASYLTAAI